MVCAAHSRPETPREAGVHTYFLPRRCPLCPLLLCCHPLPLTLCSRQMLWVLHHILLRHTAEPRFPASFAAGVTGECLDGWDTGWRDSCHSQSWPCRTFYTVSRSVLTCSCSFGAQGVWMASLQPRGRPRDLHCSVPRVVTKLSGKPLSLVICCCSLA